MKFFTPFFSKKEDLIPLLTIQVSKSALLHNLEEFRRLSPIICPVLKSNAFGHGLIEVASILEAQDSPFFIVDSLEEALILRGNKIITPILTIGYVSSLEKIRHEVSSISYSITSFEMLVEWNENITKDTKIHLKIDTGMNRQGISIDKIHDAITLLKTSPKLILEGICTHLADADNADSTFTDSQIQKWNEIVLLFKETFKSMTYFHISNTPGHSHLSKAMSSFSRLGIGLYGLNGNGNLDTLITLKPALKLTSVITGTKKIIPGSKIGYNGTYTSTTDMRIATIPIGYGVGYDRRLSNKGVMQVEGIFTPILGKVSMNITVIDVTAVNNYSLNTPVIVISNNEKDQNSIMNIAKTCNTNPHEIITGLDRFIERVVIE